MEILAAPLCTVIVTSRDRFSTAGTCLNNILKHSPEPIEIILVAGGMPANLQKDLSERFGSRVKMIFKESFMNTAELRNIGLREARTECAVCLDFDVYVRPGWLDALLRAYRETSAAMISPIVLEKRNQIHAAVCMLYITHNQGRSYGMTAHHYGDLPVARSTNIRRQAMDYADEHCQFVHVKKALNLGIYDEQFREGGDFDSGLTLRNAGESVVLEPGSHVYLYYPERLDNLADLKLFLWKWDAAATAKSFAYFENKWGIDMLSKSGMAQYVNMHNHRVGLCTRLFPTQASLAMDRAYWVCKKRLLASFTLWRFFKERIIVAVGRQGSLSKGARRWYKRAVLFIRLNELTTRLRGVENKPNSKRIEIDITYACQLKCFGCNRSCTQAPAKDHISLEQIDAFIEESIQQNRRWDTIVILGGEPTCHPDFLELVNRLLLYKKRVSPQTTLLVKSNGYGEKTKEILSQLPQEVLIESSNKTGRIQKDFYSFNVAPVDLPEYAAADFTNACRFTRMEGMGLNRYGYYPCAVAGGIDRILRLDKGRKKLPLADDRMKDQLRIFCRFCGHFKRFDTSMKSSGDISDFWRKAYAGYAMRTQSRLA